MEISVKRIARKRDYTIGRLSINGRYVCDTLEPHCIDWSIHQRTPIHSPKIPYASPSHLVAPLRGHTFGDGDSSHRWR